MTEQQPATLGEDDYRMLYDMSLSEDAGVRAQAATLAKKLTPEEGHDFVAFQQAEWKRRGGSERHREDNSVLGLPPEAAAIGIAGVARAVAGEGLTLAGRAAAGAKAVVSEASPYAKYHVVKAGLEGMGVPWWMADAAAFALSGRGRQGAAGAEDAEKTVAQSIDEAVAAGKLRRADGYTPQMAPRPTPGSVPMAPAEPVPAAAPPPAARAPMTAAPAETPIVETAPPAAAPAPATPPASAPVGRALKILIEKGGLNLSEANQALKWLQQGVPLETVQQRILDARAFQSKVPGTVTNDEVNGVIVHRRPRGPQGSPR